MGNFHLHLQSVKEILPYFAAAGHRLYTKSAYMYLQSTSKLATTRPNVYQTFPVGYHEVRRSDRLWSGLSTDLIIQQVLMRSLKTSGGMTRGRGMAEQQRAKRWLLSTSACAEIKDSMLLPEVLFLKTVIYITFTLEKLVARVLLLIIPSTWTWKYLSPCMGSVCMITPSWKRIRQCPWKYVLQ